ncbi:MAG: hypothetical protein ABMA64_22410 [Myxococcota bacterium]
MLQNAFDAVPIVSGDGVSPPPDARAGVALARRLARALGGHVAVDSRSGVGTAISLRIPIEPGKVKRVPRSPTGRDRPARVEAR